MQWLYSKWWKWLCVAILFYALIGNFFISLGPGIKKVEPTVFRPDSLYTFHITAFHAHFQHADAGKVQLRFKNRNQYFVPASFEVTGNETITAQFAISSLQQDSLRSGFDVVLNDDMDGTFALRDAITFVKAPVQDSSYTSLAVASDPEVKNNKHQFLCFPYREILYETIRNTFFHVPMWFVMTALLFVSMIGSILYLAKGDSKWETVAHQGVVVGTLFGTCGYLTGLVWSKYTWYIGTSWGDVLKKLLLEDVKMAAALVAIFFYFGYLLLRGAIEDKQKRARITSWYNIFAFVLFIMCAFVFPRLTDSMHPGNGGNPAFSKYDLDSTLRMFFYPAVIGWITLGFWIFSILMRLRFLQQKQEE